MALGRRIVSIKERAHSQVAAAFHPKVLAILARFAKCVGKRASRKILARCLEVIYLHLAGHVVVSLFASLYPHNTAYRTACKQIIALDASFFIP